jgi:hypothetical protein
MSLNRLRAMPDDQLATQIARFERERRACD